MASPHFSLFAKVIRYFCLLLNRVDRVTLNLLAGERIELLLVVSVKLLDMLFDIALLPLVHSRLQRHLLSNLDLLLLVLVHCLEEGVVIIITHVVLLDLVIEHIVQASLLHLLIMHIRWLKVLGFLVIIIIVLDVVQLNRGVWTVEWALVGWAKVDHHWLLAMVDELSSAWVVWKVRLSLGIWAILTNVIMSVQVFRILLLQMRRNRLVGIP